jgi:uncharacterized repeat protein (TIGR01451 family)
MLSEQNYKRSFLTSLALLLRKHSLVAAFSRSNCIKQLQTAYGYLTHLLVIAVVSLVSFLGLSQQAQAHTAITKTTSTPLVAPGGTATYTINVTDAGTSSATTGITVTDALPTGFTYLSTQSVNLVGGTTRPTTVNPTVGSNTPSWGTFNTPFPATPPNTFNITFDARVPIGGNCGKYDNAVTATATGGTHTYVPYTGTASTAEDVTVTGSLSASKTTSTPTVVNTPTGTQATYTIVLSNTGQCIIPNVSITDALPAGFTYASTGVIGFTGSATRPTTTNPTAGTANPVWSNFTIPNGGTVSLTFTAKIASSVANGTYNNNASATTTTAGITITPYVGTSLNQEDVTVTSPSADLTITKSHTGNFTQGQTGATYTLTAKNSGTAATSGTVNVVDSLPTGLTATAISGTGWTCTLATLTCTRSDALAAGSSYPAITLTVSVSANAASSVTNSATISGGGEINTANNGATDPTTVTALADLRLSKTATPANPSVGGAFNYTITVTNDGPSTATNVQVTDRLPSITDVLVNSLLITTSQGSAVYNVATPNIIWTVGTLAPNTSATLTIPATRLVASLTINVAEVTASDQSDPDSTPGNNVANEDDQASVTMTSAASNPKLILVKRITAINSSIINTVIDPTTTPDPNDDAPNWPVAYLKGSVDTGIVKPGDELEYTIYFLSSGDTPITKVNICDLVPANSTFIPTTYSGLSPADGGLPGADSGISLTIGPSPTFYLSNAKDADRGEFFVAGTTPSVTCSGTNDNGAVVVNVVVNIAKSIITLPNATAPGTPTNSYGLIRFRAKVN